MLDFRDVIERRGEGCRGKERMRREKGNISFRLFGRAGGQKRNYSRGLKI
jgi:hypothetical protein